jgi:hypothetical protein
MSCGCNNNHCIKVEDHSSLVKDTNSKAILSVDDRAYQAALIRKNKSKRFQQMENDISELKTLMSTLIHKLDK